MNSTALILEGGGMRGHYTAGVLDALLDLGVNFDSVYAVSAGACHAASFLSQQRGRAYDVATDFLDDWRYMSMRSLILTGDMIGNKFVYHTIPEKLMPYDNEAFKKNTARLYCVVTNVETGGAEYLLTHDMDKDIDNVRASASLPFISRIVKINGKKYLDGGIADSIPVRRALSDGNKKALVVLTQHKGYVKEPSASARNAGLVYGKYPKFVEAMKTRHIRYNETLSFIEEAEKRGEVLTLRPKEPVRVKRIDKDREKLRALYEDGCRDCMEMADEIKKFVNK